MLPLNAIDAIAPAFTRTHETLFQPFRLGRSWKLAAASYLGFCGNIFIPFPLLVLAIPRQNLAPGLKVLVTVAMAVASVLLLALFYFGARMEFVNFEKLLTRSKFIAPIWRRYGGRVWPMIAVKVLIGTVITAAMASPLVHMVHEYIALMESMPRATPGVAPDPVLMQQQMHEMFSHLGAVYLVLYGFIFLLKIFSTLLNDFVLPFYLLEPVTLGAAIRRGVEVIFADPLQVALYLAMKLILSILGFILYFVAFLITELILIIPLMIAVFLGVLLAALMGPSGKLLLVAGAIVLYTAFAVVIGYIAIGSFGYLLTLLEAYAIYFLGGRYPMLGNLLDPGPGAPFTPPPVFPSPEEQNDDDGGPPLPMDPALA